MEKLQPYTAINASAGSGKTYTLVQRVLMLCLAFPGRQDAIRHILALTFTNKAANEMKERILKMLKSFTADNYAENKDLENIRQSLEKLGIHTDADELHRRAQKVLDYILHHYSTLNIGTIDKFNSRLVRSFSYELGLPHQFTLEVQSEPFLIEAVDKMLDEIGSENQISEAFLDFMNYNMDNEQRVNISRTLYNKAKHFVNDVHYEDLKSNENFDWEAYEGTKAKLRNDIAELKNYAKKLAENAAELMRERHLENSDFYGGSNKCIKYFFDSFLANGEPKLMESTEAESSKVEYYRKGASKSGQAKAAMIDEILEDLIDSRQKIIASHVLAEKKKKIQSELLPLKINKEIQDQLEAIEQENDLVLLSKFNILIGEKLKNEPSGFIYEKIGTRYQHFFFDEFQDTSKMQWENILPLKEHTISSEDSSFTLVGDPKQSIYRFRGGDSDLMLGILNRKESSTVPVSIEVLENNWRSARNIVSFNNELYSYLSQNLEKEHRELFSEKAQQKAVKKYTGRVKVCLTDYDKSAAVFFENAAMQMQACIQECLDNGFKFKDITILCRSGREIQRFAQLLGALKVNEAGEETYIRTISEKGLTLELSLTLKAVVELLRWQIQPENRQFLVRMLYHLNKLGRIEINDFTADMLEILALNSDKAAEDFISAKYGIRLSIEDLPQFNLYNRIEYFVREFSVPGKETDYLLNFLEALYGYTQNAGLTVKDFVKYWDEEASKMSIQASENVNNIKMMTVHAAKGLEFPVVFLPMRNAHKDAKFSDWMPLDGLGALHSVNIAEFNKNLASYDEEIAAFNSENNYKNKIDRFCLQYVATTRPVEQLFLFLEKPSKENNYIEMLEFLNRKNPENADEFDIYPETGNSFRKQNVSEEEALDKIEIKAISNDHEGFTNIKIATPSKSYQNRVATVRTGIFTHEILAKIKTAEDTGRVLESYLLAGEISKSEAEAIRERIRNVLDNEDFAKYFEPGLKIINEKEILLSTANGSKSYRPDRLIQTDEGFYIIDFKTGAEQEKHEEQTEKYRQILEQLGSKVLETKIIYI